MKKFLFTALFLAAVLSASAVMAATEIDRVVAVVGQNVITLSELQSEMAPALNELNQRYRGDELARMTERLKRSTLNNLIDKYLQIQEAKLQGIEVTTKEIDDAVADIMKKNNMDKAAFAAALENEGYSVNDYRKNLTEQLMILRLVNRAVKSKISIKEEEIVNYYNQNKEKFSEKETVRIANISFPAVDGDMDKALKSAEDARAQITAGTAFEDMAAKCVGNPEAAKTCVLGTFSRGEMTPAIEEKAFKMAEGEVSEPIRMNKEYQLIKVVQKTPAVTKTLAEARPQIVDALSSKQGEAYFARWVQDLRKHTYVEVREF